MSIDVVDADSIATAAAEVNELTGGNLAGLVNNAGIALAGPVEGLELDLLRRQFEVNVFGQVAVTKAFLPAIRSAKGRVVFMSSVGGKGALPYISPYSSSKHAIEAIGDALRMEMRPFGVEVAIIEPGSVATPIWEKSGSEAAAAREQLDARDRRALWRSAWIRWRRSPRRPACAGSIPTMSPTRSSTRSRPPSQRRATSSGARRRFRCGSARSSPLAGWIDLIEREIEKS